MSAIEPKCPACAHGLVKDGAKTFCLNCNWSATPAALSGLLRVLTADEVAASFINQGAALRREMAALELQARQKEQEAKRFEKLAAAITGVPSAAKPGPKPLAPDGERWHCPNCDFVATGAYPGRHTSSCRAVAS